MPRSTRTAQKAKSLKDLKSLSELRKYLQACHKNQWGYRLKETNPQSEIIDFIAHTIAMQAQKNNQLIAPADVFGIMKALEDIDNTLNLPKQNYFSASSKIFDAYRLALQNKNIPAASLGQLRLLLEKEDYFKNLLNTPSKWYELFSARKTAYEKAVQLKNALGASPSLPSEEAVVTPEYASPLAKLLDQFLSGKTAGVFVKGTIKSQEDFDNYMNNREYWLSEETEGVGASKVFLALTTQAQSILSQFSAKYLTQNFMRAFPWAIALTQANPIDAQISNNLLNTSQPLPPKIQEAVMSYVFLSLDLIGKHCGKDGAMLLKNYDKIYHLAQGIETLQKSLEDPIYCQSSKFLKQLNKKIELLTQEEGNCFNKIQKNEGFYDLNRPINNFCLLNERRACQLLNLDFQKSALTPSEPDGPTQAIIIKFFPKQKKPVPPQKRFAIKQKQALKEALKHHLPGSPKQAAEAPSKKQRPKGKSN